MKIKKVNEKPRKSVKGKKTTNIKKQKKHLSKVTTAEFFEQNFEDNTDDSENEIIKKPNNASIRNDKNIDKNSKQDDSESNSDSDEGNLDPVEHKKVLMKLKDLDPEFYEYLQENDQNLLDFNISDDEEDDDDQNNDRHIPNENLEIASDDSDFDGETENVSKKKVTLQLLKTWQEQLQTHKSSTVIKCAVDAFHAALNSVQVLPADKNDTVPDEYVVEGSKVFNGVIQLCVTYLPTAFKDYLKCDPKIDEIHKSKRFRKIRGILKSYLADLIKLLQCVGSPSSQVILLKHLREMMPYAQAFSSLTKPLLKILLQLWAVTDDDAVRVTAFLNTFYIASRRKELEKLLKIMYIKYVQNAKFVSPNSLPGINFMMHSLVEIYLIDPNLSYSYAFVFIRQLAIHLRNAITLKKKENFQTVYNWQYINSLRFWMNLLIKSKENSMLRSLVYPLVQIITGTIKLIPTAQYYPLRFHCVEMLINISKEIGSFIPILPFLLEVLNSYDFNKKHKTVSMRPLLFMYTLRASKSQLVENGFKNSVFETIHKLLFEYAANESHHIYFPDLFIFCTIQVRVFLKKCKIATFCNEMKKLLRMIEENRKYIETERSRTVMSLKDTAEIANWENRIKTDGTKLAKSYASWIKIYESQKLKHLAKKSEEEIVVPAVRKSKKHKLEENAEDSDSESEFELRIKGSEEEIEESSHNITKKKKIKKKKKLANNAKDEELPRENTDIVQDIDINDWD
ncbi:nucleolar complex protein 2 homolog isoform X2 [Pseudomyrmex gracilis]|uniref:nucleolar complex protein 2 homolog isoform X2 n=1 Tax=Pseudomyrmex gracilis TaxID=219809 RepID=UPI0009954E43|nr:nucleolar complex protein 2 homolog isoform X2 [Pseudomyrmex gracilis]